MLLRLSTGASHRLGQRPSAPWSDGERPSQHPRPRPPCQRPRIRARAGRQRRRLHSGRGNPSRGSTSPSGRWCYRPQLRPCCSVATASTAATEPDAHGSAASWTTLGAASRGAMTQECHREDRDARADETTATLLRAHGLLTGWRRRRELDRRRPSGWSTCQRYGPRRRENQQPRDDVDPEQQSDDERDGRVHRVSHCSKKARGKQLDQLDAHGAEERSDSASRHGGDAPDRRRNSTRITTVSSSNARASVSAENSTRAIPESAKAGGIRAPRSRTTS